MRRHLGSPAVRVVMVTRDADALKARLVAGEPSPISYNAPKAKELLDEDKAIERYPIPLGADDVTVVPVDRVFQ